MNIMGVDCGMNGALTTMNGVENIVYDMPTYQITKGKSLRKRIDIRALLKILRDEKPDHVYIEQVSAQFGNGASSAFTYGQGVGIVEACVVACDLPFTYVTAMSWKKAMCCPADKDAARMRASQLLPSMSHNWERKKDDGRAESALICLWGMKQILNTNKG